MAECGVLAARPGDGCAHCATDERLGLGLSAAPRVEPTAALDFLVDIACDAGSPIVVAEGGAPLGSISRRSLLTGIQGRA
jgi:hypothetical protein